MRLILVRHTFHRNWTLGTLYEDYIPYCFTLEDPDRFAVDLAKVPGETAIPTGEYRIYLTHSPRFGRTLPVLDNVPAFTGVRIHPGNTAADTEGCILVGQQTAMGRAVRSRLAFEPLYERMLQAERSGVSTMLGVKRLDSPWHRSIMDRLRQQWGGKTL